MTGTASRLFNARRGWADSPSAAYLIHSECSFRASFCPRGGCVGDKLPPAQGQVELVGTCNKYHVSDHASSYARKWSYRVCNDKLLRSLSKQHLCPATVTPPRCTGNIASMRLTPDDRSTTLNGSAALGEYANDSEVWPVRRYSLLPPRERRVPEVVLSCLIAPMPTRR